MILVGKAIQSNKTVRAFDHTGNVLVALRPTRIKVCSAARKLTIDLLRSLVIQDVGVDFDQSNNVQFPTLLRMTPYIYDTLHQTLYYHSSINGYP